MMTRFLECTGDPLCWIVQVTRFVGLYRWPTLLDCTGDPLCWIVQEACCTCTTRQWRALIGWCRTWPTVTTATCVSTVSSTSSFTSSKPRPQILVSARTVVALICLRSRLTSREVDVNVWQTLILLNVYYSQPSNLAPTRKWIESNVVVVVIFVV